MRFRVLHMAVAAMLMCFAIPSNADDRSDAIALGERLYQKGHYQRALDLLENVTPQDVMSEGYALLCKARLCTEDYEAALVAFESRYGRTVLAPWIDLVYARNLFAEERYPEALSRYSSVPETAVSYKEYTEVLFKKAYCHSATGRPEEALELYEQVIGRRKSDFTSPSLYAAGYIKYSDNDFIAAEQYFLESVKDERFREQSSYYLLECRFMQRDYDYVIKNGGKVYADAPEARRPHLARILSETYLVTGDAARANAYYKLADTSADSRADLFYAGSLQYALKNWRGAVDKFSRMGDLTDSIGQIAAYQLGYSCIQTKDKVSAMEAFRQASATSFNADIKEDAYLNYAKLAFDLNYDSAPFEQYMRTWPQNGKNDMIYDYIAVASLYKHDYAAAISAYDRIDKLGASMRGNYVKANYLLAEQLIRGGSYSDAIEPLNAVTAYAGRASHMGKLSRYWLAESNYRAGYYLQAGSIFTDLYNNSALEDRAEGKLLSYNIAYCYFRSGDYPAAARWFGKYVDAGDATAREDALLRRADCHFIRQDYKEAAAMYALAKAEIGRNSTLYPVYQEGLAYGFLGNVSQKAKVLSDALGAAPSTPFYPEAVYELGRSYVSLHKDNEARSAFKALAARSADSTYVAKSLVELAMIDRNAGNYDAALEQYKRVVENYGRTESADGALMAIESIYQSMGEPDKYFAYAEQLGRSVGSEEEKERAFFNSVEQIYRTGNYDRAIVAISRYLEAYPEGIDAVTACYYMGESHRAEGDAEKALTWYAKVIETGGASSYVEPSMLACADINFRLGRYSLAYDDYVRLHSATSDGASRLSAESGMLRSSYKARNYDGAVVSADLVLGNALATDADSREARYVKAKSLLSTSRREEAYGLFETLAKSPATAEGAEASYLLVQDVYDRGQFDKVEEMVYDFAGKAGGQSYWLAKAYIVLGDAFVENDNLKQARATFESVLSGYEPSSAEDDVLDVVKDRIARLDSIAGGV